jgi:hypothetical protein
MSYWLSKAGERVFQVFYRCHFSQDEKPQSALSRVIRGQILNILH